VGFDQPSYNISEGAGLLNVCAILTGVADREVLVTLTTMEISAEGSFSHLLFLIHCKILLEKVVALILNLLP